MTKKRVLLTGDDGYNSIGTRLLVKFLKDSYDLSIAGTKSQQSGVGGYASFVAGGTWGETDIDGVPALWVDGYPVDAMECAVGYFKKKFDFIFSGINWGANVSGSIASSGTYAASFRGLFLQLAPRAINISWYTPPSHWFKQDHRQSSLDEFLEYPGKTAAGVTQLADKEDFWGAATLNINLPYKKSSAIRFTKFIPDLTKYYIFPLPMDSKTHRFSYLLAERKNKKFDIEYDAGAMLRGYISITPCQADPLDKTVYGTMKDRQFDL